LITIFRPYVKNQEQLVLQFCGFAGKKKLFCSSAVLWFCSYLRDQRDLREKKPVKQSLNLR